MSPLPAAKSPHGDASRPQKQESSSTSSASVASQAENGHTRGRKQERDGSEGDRGNGTMSGDDQKPGNNGNGERKRKRSRKGLDKKYLCPQDDCGKSYSRAEHLYRHQLNHTPKQIYRCDFPECPRWFVRQDLCTRHRERHTTRGSHIQRKDTYVGGTDQPNPTEHATHGLPVPNHVSYVPTDLSINTTTYNHQQPYEGHSGQVQSPLSDQTVTNHHQPSIISQGAFRSPQSYNSSTSGTTFGSMSSLHRSNSDSQYFGDTNMAGHDAPTALRSTPSSGYDQSRHASMDTYGATRFQQPVSSNNHHAIQSPDQPDSPSQYRRTPVIHQLSLQSGQRQDTGYNNFVAQQQFPPLTTLPPPVYPPATKSTAIEQQQYYNSGDVMRSQSIQADEMAGVIASDSPLTDGSLPMFDGDGYTRSPVVMADNFAAWLFSINDGQVSGSGHRRSDSSMLDPSLRLPLGGSMPVVPPQHSMAVTSILDSTSKRSILSESKRQQLLELIELRFNESNHSPVANQKEELLSGDRDRETHVLSLRSLQTYIGSYWYHFHDQMPILHQPTFSADNAQNLLLIAVIAIGAANLDKIHGEQVTNAGAELANFLAWHLRGELFMDQDFRPPAKLWVLQTLLLLEAYEKLYSSRVLHERSQIHHATTVSLLRRGSSLLGRSAMDSPPSFADEKSSIVNTPDPWWNHWITNEATKRVAFAAFIIDSTHATMFSHTAVMVAHEMRLSLPCDECLWQATSGLEVSRIEAKLREEGIKPISFLDGLKWTLNDRPIRTNVFGRTALMAGLLNVSFHLGQRDMQVRSLGVTLGGKDVWRGTLTKAFDIWERDWDNRGDIKKEPGSSAQPHTSFRSSKDPENVFESRVVLHHLAHMGMHVDIVQCQIFARAKRLLGRSITPSDYNSTARRMREIWATKASARDAVFYSLRFIAEVLTPNIAISQGTGTRMPTNTELENYSPRDDYALNRPWVLYFAALVVWSYGYALDGYIKTPLPNLNTKADQTRDMYTFMRRVGGVNAPDDLATLTDRNQCAGLLCVLRTQFRNCRWELMDEAATLLGNCIQMLKGEEVD